MFPNSIVGTSLKVITASVIGSLMCAIMIVIAVGCTCKLHTNRMYESLYQRSRYESPLSRITNALLNRAAPPPYAEAMQRSRPFEEVQSDSGEVMEEQHSIASASGALDTTDSSLIEMAEDNSVSYRRNPNKPLESAQLPDLPLVLLDQPTPAVLEPKSDEEEGGSDDAPITTNLSFNENDDNSSPSRRQMIRHNSGDSDVSLLSRSSDDVPLLT
ncbi:LRP12 [Bugula neritina]|uniref:LRP12 n=1 Tax=Bugula neritina TaxID=10212 RepID=A0A7J7K4G0_BUGNE|nr:LRP12 [Bugula neritina]